MTRPIRFSESRESLNALVGENQPDPSPTYSIVYKDEALPDKGGPVPNYRFKLAHHIDATSPVGGLWYKVSSTKGVENVVIRRFLTGVWVRETNRNVGNVTLSVGAFGVPSTSGLADANNAAVMEFNKRSLAKITNLSSGVVLGELRQTLQFIKNPLKSLRDAVNRYRGPNARRRLGRTVGQENRRAARRAIRDSWLTFAYGVKPLVSDIRAGAEALAKYNYGTLDIVPVSAFAQRDKLISDSSSLGAVGNITRGTRNKVVETDRVTFRGEIRVASGGKQSISSLLQADWGAIPLVAWELIPYSFLVDYFTNVGDVLSAWATGSIDYCWKNFSQRSEYIWNLTTFYPNKVIVPPPGSVLAEDYSSCEVNTVTTKWARNSVSGVLFPALRWEIPGYKSLKWLNIAALADGRYRH